MIDNDIVSGFKFGAMLALIALLVTIIFYACGTRADNGAAVNYLLEKGNTPARDSRWENAARFEELLVNAAESQGIDPALFVAMAFLESSFDPKAVGKLGEKGLVQVHGMAQRGCDLTTPEGQATCGARWLQVGVSECGGHVVLDKEKCLKTASPGACSGGLSAYASGSCAASEKVAWVVRRRLKLAEQLRPFMSGGVMLASGGVR